MNGTLSKCSRDLVLLNNANDFIAVIVLSSVHTPLPFDIHEKLILMIDFERTESAVSAISGMQGAYLGGQSIKIDFGTEANVPPPPHASGRAFEHHHDDKSTPRRSLYLSFPRDIVIPTERVLFEEFSQFGRVVSVKVVPDLHYAFANFDEVNEAQAALDIQSLI